MVEGYEFEDGETVFCAPAELLGAADAAQQIGAGLTALAGTGTGEADTLVAAHPGWESASRVQMAWHRCLARTRTRGQEIDGTGGKLRETVAEYQAADAAGAADFGAIGPR